MDSVGYSAVLDHAIEADKQGDLRAWTEKYLSSEGDNKKLAAHIRNHPNATVILKEYPLSELPRVCGPEEGMIWREEPSAWRTQLDRIKAAIKAGYVVPPLIATDFWGDIHISDGNHRHGALRELGVDKYWVIFFLKNSGNAAKLNAQRD